MSRNEKFFRNIWPGIAEQVTRHRAGADADLLPLLRRLGVPRGARVLDVPCGFGRHALLLARRGYGVTGVDISAELLAQARACSGAAQDSRRGISARRRSYSVLSARERANLPGSTHRNRPLQNLPEFIRGDMRRLRFRGEFDLVLNLFTSFGYFGDRGDQRVLDSFYRALRPGGHAVIHMINRDYIVRHFRPRGVSRLKDFRLDERVTMDWPSSTIRTEWTVRFKRGGRLRIQLAGRGAPTFAQPHSTERHAGRGARNATGWKACATGVTQLRIYSCHELKAMLERAGFRRVQAFGGFRGEPVSMERIWLLLVGQR